MKKMKALNLHGVGDLRYQDVPIPKCLEDEVIVAIKGAGICGSDKARIFKTGTYHFPTIPGHEFSGEIVSSSNQREIGKRVCVFPLLPCFKCQMCKSGNYATCADYDYYGSRRNGAFSEYIAVKRWNLIYLPDNVDYDEGAMCEPASVARHAVLKVVKDGVKDVLISGAGPIALIAAQWCKIFGAENIYMFDVDERKVEFAKKMGFYEYTDDISVDAVIEGTGAADALKKCISAVKSQGAVVLMGNPSDDVNLDKNIYQSILRKELTLLGTWNSLYNDMINDWKETIAAISEGKLKLKPLITHKFKLSEYEEALKVLTDGTTFYNKIMFVDEK